jgi:NADH:ubiquinone oxidoreductase subunit 5 (subunit L)/multisubunit Na+/H+ antiporter MnhA subunit
MLFDKVLENVISESVFSVEWVSFVGGSLRWGFVYDFTTALMVSTVCTVSTLVHLYSLYYMEQDPSLRRFITYLSLFTFFMLFLIGSNNLLQLFFAWEGVGLCSYLLINFWFTRLQANKAALKAMLMNRFGGCGLIFTIVLIITHYGNVRYDDMFTGLAFSSLNYI